jgi:hypothetical protein
LTVYDWNGTAGRIRDDRFGIEQGLGKGGGRGKGEGGREAGREGRERVHRDDMRLWAE